MSERRNDRLTRSKSNSPQSFTSWRTLTKNKARGEVIEGRGEQIVLGKRGGFKGVYDPFMGILKGQAVRRTEQLRDSNPDGRKQINGPRKSSLFYLVEFFERKDRLCRTCSRKIQPDPTNGRGSPKGYRPTPDGSGCSTKKEGVKDCAIYSLFFSLQFLCSSIRKGLIF